MNRLKRLLAICRRHFLDSDSSAVVPEPYIPLIPERWNRTLVLAEAQNLSDKSASYVMWLKSASSEIRMQRLGRNGHVGVGPWDDGSLKLAVASALQIEAEECAISNGVPWSLVSADGKNLNPSSELLVRSVPFWVEMLLVLQPAHIVTVGSKAREVISAALNGSQLKPEQTMWTLPSPRLLSPLAGMVHEVDLRRRFPEVDQVVDKHPEWLQGANRKNKILFACLTVSQTATKATYPRGER